MKYILHIFIFSIFLQTNLFASYDPTLTGYGTAVAYQGRHLDCFLDVNANTNEGNSASPYGIVTTGSCLLNTSTLPNYPLGALQTLPCVARFNRDGTKDTNFGNFFPGTGFYIQDPSTNIAYPSFFPGSGRSGKLVFLSPAGLSPIYFWIYRNGAPQTSFSLYKYLPLTGRLDASFAPSGTPYTLTIHNETGSAITATVTSACSVPVSGGQTNPQTTSDIYVTYYDGSGNSYIAALKYVSASNSFVYDTTFATNGVIKFASGTGGAGTIRFNSINYDSVANAGAGALLVSGVTGNGNVIIARYKNLTTTAVLDTSFNTNGYAIIAAPGGTTSAVISQYIFSKIVSGTQYYYCTGYDASGPQLDICYFNPSTYTFVDLGSGLVVNVGVTGIYDTYQIYDMVQIPDSSNTQAVAIAVGAGDTQSTYAGIINFQFEAPIYDWNNVNSVAMTDVDATAIGQSGGNLFFYSCLFDPSLYAPSPESLPGVFVGGNFGTNGCLINYTYGLEPSGVNPAYGMIPYSAVGSGVGFLDYTTSTYPGGFISQQVFYSGVSGTSSYYMVVQGLKSSGVDFGIVRFNEGNNSFDYTFGGAANPFCLVASNVSSSASALDSNAIMYTVGVATTGTGFSVGDLVLTAFDISPGGSFGLVSTFSRNSQADNGIIPYSLSTFSGLGGTSFTQLDLALQNVGGGATQLIVAGTNNLLVPGFVARFNTISSSVGDGILDLSFGATNAGYNIFNPLGDTSLSSCAVDTVQNIVVAGSIGGATPSTGQLVVARYTPNGILDVNFGPAPQVGYGYFSLLGLSGIGYGISVNNITFDPGTNIYIVGQYTAPLATSSTTFSTSPFISRLVSLGVQDSTFYDNYGTFLIPLQYVDGAGIFQKCLYDINPISNLSSGTMYAIGYINETVNNQTAPFATLIRFSIQGLNLSTSQALNSGTASSAPTNLQGNICPDLVVPPIYVVNQISSPQGSGVYTFNSIKTVSDVENVLSLSGILYNLNTNLLAAGASTTLATQIVSNFKNIIETLIINFVAAYPGLLLTNILYLSQAIATNECLLTNNGSLIVSDPNQLQAIYGAESTLQNNIKTAAEYCTNTLVSPYN